MRKELNRHIENQRNEKIRELLTLAKNSCTNKRKQNSKQIGSAVNNIFIAIII